ncbi:MAG: DEAD/DEAH box helicase, partial [Pseudomonadota bacterium]
MKKKPTKAKNKKERIIDNSGWNTTDIEEINRRRLRASAEEMLVKNLEPEIAYFGTYSVKAGSGNNYIVEIRSFDQDINSCSCADYDTNKLGTCKHIEKVTFTLKSKAARKFSNAKTAGSNRIEIFVDHKTDKIVFSLPRDLYNSDSYELIEDFFASDGTLISECEIGIPAIKRAINNAPAAIAQQIRLSARLEALLARGASPAHKQKAKEYFLQDVQSGKRSLDIMKLPLYPYQQEGMLHLAFTERAFLADEMGLGKTVQAIAACELLYRLYGIKKVLVVATTSLKSEWEEQITKFCHLPSLIITGNRAERLQKYQQEAFFYITNYEQIRIDLHDIQQIISPDVIILDEAQRIKNWRTKTSATIKSLKSKYAFVLTGTPVENRIEDIYSLVQFLDPHLFGALFRFNRQFYSLDEKGRPTGYKNLDILHQKLKPVMLRRRKAEVEGELPERTVNNYFVQMTEEQRLRYSGYEGEVAKLAAIARRRALLESEFKKLQRSLAAMRMLCDTPYILDEECRICPKLDELDKVFEELLDNPDTKIIIFSEWERMLRLVKEYLSEKNIGFAWHTGSVSQQKRIVEIKNFKTDNLCRVFLSTDAGSVGLNLQVANVVINLDIPWNPAKLEQRIARAWRKNQMRSVQVINMVSENTIEHRMLGLLKQKQALADNILETGDDAEMSLPSGRAAMMERLEEVLGHTSQPQEKPVPTVQEIAPVEILREEIMARFEPRLERLESYGSNLLAVVDGNAAEPKQKMQEILAANNQDTNLSLEVLDKATYDTIMR